MFYLIMNNLSFDISSEIILSKGHYSKPSSNFLKAVVKLQDSHDKKVTYLTLITTQV